MSDRNKFIDDLIDAGAQDDEIEEALKLAESRGEFSSVSPTPPQQTQPKKEGFFSGIGSDLAKRGESLNNNARRDESLPEYAIQQVGELAGGVNDVAGRVLSPLGKAIGGLAKEYTPNLYKAGKATGEAVGRGINKALPDLNSTLTGTRNSDETVRGIGNILMLGGLAKAVSPVAKEAGVAVDAAVNSAKNVSKDAGLKIANVITKPKERDFKAGFKTEHLYDYDLLQNDMGKTVEKTQSTIEDYANQLKQKLAEGNEAGATVNMNSVIDKSIASIKNDKSVLGKQTKIDALENLRGEILSQHPTGEMNLVDAQMLKREIGAEGAWLESHGGKMIDKDATKKAQAYSTAYGQLKTGIEDAAPEGVKEINQHLSNLIPIENALLKRMYVSQRNEVIPLKDMVSAAAAMTGHPAAWLLTGANRLANSASVGKGLYNLGKKNVDELPPAMPPEKPLPSDVPSGPAPQEPNLDVPTFQRKGIDPKMKELPRIETADFAQLLNDMTEEEKTRFLQKAASLTQAGGGVRKEINPKLMTQKELGMLFTNSLTGKYK